MMTILSGVGMLLLTLAVFSLFSMKMPKGSLAMSGMANAAVATFLWRQFINIFPATFLAFPFSKVWVRTQVDLAVWQQQSQCRSAWEPIQYWLSQPASCLDSLGFSLALSQVM